MVGTDLISTLSVKCSEYLSVVIQTKKAEGLIISRPLAPFLVASHSVILSQFLFIYFDFSDLKAKYT